LERCSAAIQPLPDCAMIGVKGSERSHDHVDQYRPRQTQHGASTMSFLAELQRRFTGMPYVMNGFTWNFALLLPLL
jgi:hypothetical protein